MSSKEPEVLDLTNQAIAPAQHEEDDLAARAKPNDISPSMSRQELKGRQNGAVQATAISTNKPQTWQESMSYHWSTVGRGSLDRTAGASSPSRTNLATKR